MVKGNPFITIFIVGCLLGTNPAVSCSSPQWRLITDWLVCGPFPSLGSMPEFYRDKLVEIGGEEKVEPTPGLTLHSKSLQEGIEEWYGKVVWQPYHSEDGYVDFGKLYTTKTGELAGPWRRVAYAFCRIKSPARRRVLFEVRTDDALQLWVNHKQVIYNRLFRGGWRQGGVDLLVVDLEKGSNPVLVKLGDYRYSGWGFAMRWAPVTDKIYINTKDLLLPHLRVGEKLAGWGYISLVNTSDEPLADVEVEVEGDDLFASKKTKVDVLKPRWDSRAAFWIETKRAVTPADSAAQLKLTVRTRGETHTVLLKPEVRPREVYFTRTYRSEVDGSVQPYSLLVPPEYDGTKPFPLLVVLHGAHVKECIGCYKMRDWVIIATPYGRGNTGYREIGTNDVFRVIEEIKKHYNIDQNRIYLAGHSMGGHGTWYLGMHYPDRWAALNPMSGYGDYRLWKENIPDWQVPLYEDRSAIFFVENALHLPVFIIHGARDEEVCVEQSRRMAGALEELGYEVVYDEHPDKPHWWGMDFPEAIAFLKKHRRSPYPKEVIFKTNRLKHNRSYWVQIDQICEVPKMAKIHARIKDDNHIEVEAENVYQYTLLLNKHLIDPKQPVVIRTNGTISFSGKLPDLGKITLRAELDERGEIIGYALAQRAGEGLTKTHALFGPIIDAYNSKFIYVYGTIGSPRDTEVNLREARQDALDWRTWANGTSVIKSDVEVTAEDIENCNLILYGGPNTNAITLRINDQLPIQIKGEAVVAGDRKYVGEEIGLKMIYPNPLNPRRYLLINAGVTSKAVEGIHRIGDPLYDPLPDYVIFDKRDIAYDRHYFLEAGFFDKNWQLKSNRR